MFTRVFLLLFSITTLLLAEPSFSQMKQAVIQNPALLDTPQAKAMMEQKGVSKSDITSRLAKSNVIAKTVIGTDNIENKLNIIDVNDSNLSNENNESNVTIDMNVSKPSANPFAYQTNIELKQELDKRQQLLINKKLTRYSMSFYANKNMINSASLPTPEDYIISQGDRINVHIYGDRDKQYKLRVSNEGEVDVEFIGPLRVGGMSYKEMKKYLSHQLKQHFKMSSFKISMSKYSTIQVTLIGDVKYPGIYNLPSFSSIKELLLASKGVRDNASIRDIQIKRAGKTIADLDFYDLLFKAKNIGSVLLKHGDIVVIKRAKKLVSIDGYVNSAAIFELKGKENLKNLIHYAGGMKAEASKRHIKIERYSHNIAMQTFNIPYNRAQNFQMQDGDKVYIYKLDSSSDSSVNLYGNIIRPGAYSIPKEGTLNALLQGQMKFGAKRFFLPETYLKYGVIKRYSNSLIYETQSFNLKNVLDSKITIKLNPQDKIYIFSKNDIESSAYITTKGKDLIHPGKLRYINGMTLQDAINASGKNGILDDKVRVTTIHTPNRMPKTTYYSLSKDASVKLSPYDEIEVYDYYKVHQLLPISIKGEVINPTTVFYEKGMTLAKLLEAAGGMTNKAYLENLEIVRYFIDKENNRKKKVITLNLQDANAKEFKLEPYDEVTVFTIPNWGKKRVVTLKGEVKFPGVYTVSNGEKLSSVIKRAGGFTKEAFITGAVFTRDSIRRQQIEQYNSSLAKIKRQLAIYNAMPANAKSASSSAQTSATLNNVMKEAEKYQPIGRVSIALDRNITKFKQSQFNLVLKDKDTLTVPSYIDTVTVYGEVFNPTSFVYNKNLDADNYIAMASGLSRGADKDSIYVIHANGASEPLDNGWFGASVKIKRGDTIVVPLYIKETNNLDVWEAVARVVSSFSITAATMHTLGAF